MAAPGWLDEGRRVPESRTTRSVHPASAGPALVVFSGFLLLAAIALLLPGHAAAQTNPPVSGDWIVADQTVMNGGTISVSGNLIVTSTGSLTLNGVSLRMGSTFPGEFAIQVANGGYLAVSGGSITAVSPTNTYRFELMGAADLDNVQPIRDMWGSQTQDKFGIQVYNGNFTLTNSSVNGGDRGNLLLSAAGTPYIADNVISGSHYVRDSSTANWCQAFVDFVAYGILVTNNSAPTITRNTLRDNGATSPFFDPWQEFYDANWATQCNYNFYYVYEYMLGYGIFVRGASPNITNNQIVLNGGLPGGTVSRVINGTTVTSYRYSEDQNTGAISAGLGLSGAGKGNVTGNTIDRNFGAGVFGDGSQAFFEHNLISNHTTSPGIVVSGGLTGANLTMRNNLYSIVLTGGGNGRFDHMDLGFSNTSTAVLVDYQAAGVLSIYNTTFLLYNSTQTIYFQSYAGAMLNLFNCSINPDNIEVYQWGRGSVNVYWSLRMHIQWPNGAPAGAAFAILTNQSDGVLYADRVDDVGDSPDVWIAALRIILNGGGTTDETGNTELSVRVYANGTISEPFDFHFNDTTVLVITISDPIPPSLNVFFPLDNQGFTTSTVRVSGNAFDVGSGMARVEASVDGGDTWITSIEPLPGWSVDLALADGTYDIWVRATDQSGTTTNFTISGVRIDTVAPHIVILQPSLPASGPLISYTTFAAVGLQGTVADDTTLTLNGNALAVQGGTFSRQLILNEGPNYFELIAVDGVGNKDQVSFILVSDITKPALFVSSPTDNFATNRSVITIAGVSETDVAVTLNDRSIHTTGGVFSEPYALSEGPNTIRITATDRAGNNATITRTVIFDTVPPDIFLSSPTPNMLTAVSDLTVAGSVESAISMVYVNGAPVPTNHGAFSKAIRLDEGRNVVVVSAWDPAGNPATTSAVVTLDSMPPEVALTAPLEGALVNTATITVRGTIANATRLVLNGINLTGATDAFDEEIALVEGANLITLVVYDAAGNTARTQVTVFRDSQAPVLAVDLPETPKHTMDNVVTVTGHVTGAASLRANGQLVAFDSEGAFTVTVTLAMGENRITFSALDTAGNENTVLGAVVRDPIPPEPQGMLGLGDMQYLLLIAFLGAGIAGTFVVLRRPRKGEI